MPGPKATTPFPRRSRTLTSRWTGRFRSPTTSKSNATRPRLSAAFSTSTSATRLRWVWLNNNTASGCRSNRCRPANPRPASPACRTLIWSVRFSVLVNHLPYNTYALEFLSLSLCSRELRRFTSNHLTFTSPLLSYSPNSYSTSYIPSFFISDSFFRDFSPARNTKIFSTCS